jgi:hypothetical protein
MKYILYSFYTEVHAIMKRSVLIEELFNDHTLIYHSISG